MRRLFSFLSLISLLLFAGTIALWLQRGTHIFAIEYGTTSTYAFICSEGSTLFWGRTVGQGVNWRGVNFGWRGRWLQISDFGGNPNSLGNPDAFGGTTKPFNRDGTASPPTHHVGHGHHEHGFTLPSDQQMKPGSDEPLALWETLESNSPQKHKLHSMPLSSFARLCLILPAAWLSIRLAAWIIGAMGIASRS